MNAKELLTEFLNKIGWSLKTCGCEHYRIQDHKKNDTEYMLWDSSISMEDDNSTVTVFRIIEENVKLIDNNTVCIGTDDNFVLFMNHDT